MNPDEDKTHEKHARKGPGAVGDGQPGEGDQFLPRRASPQQGPGDQAGNVPIPPPALGAGGSTGQQPVPKGTGGEGLSTGRGKKRGRPPKLKEATTSDALVPVEGERPKKKVEFDAPEIPRPCSECGRQFNNYKALFGHMRTHPGRVWRGAFPPPSISPPSSPVRDIVRQGEQLASNLLSIGQKILEASKKGSNETATSVGNEPTSSMHPRGLDIDLNVPLDPIPSEPSSPAEEAENTLGIDLNKEASNDSEDNNQ